MSEPALHKNLLALGMGIEACLEKQHIAPALILLYSAIDTTGWLDSANRDATRESLMTWVDRYLLKAKPLGCTSLDLYAARCGLLHTLTPDSRLSLNGEARRICYAWGSANAQDLQRAIDLRSKSDELVAVHIDELYAAWRIGLLAFTEEIEHDPARESRVYAKAGKFFADLGISTLQNVIRILEQK